MTNSKNFFIQPQDRMIDPVSKNVLSIDDRLLLRETWIMEPELVNNLLLQMINDSDNSGLSLLAKNFISLTKEPLPLKMAKPPTDFALVLGHVLNSIGRPSLELVSRLNVALELFRENPGIKIITSGNGAKLNTNESTVMRDWLVENGVPSSSIFLEQESKDTVENILFSTKLLKSHNAESVVLITSRSHMGRAFNLLSSHINNNKESFKASYQVSLGPSPTKSEYAVEQFLLFKDLGRILGVWDYQSIQSNVVKNKIFGM